MCGIAGGLESDPSGTFFEDLLGRMMTILQHRGPDDQGVWVEGPVGLGSRRLSIIDLSPRARQPMANEDGSLRIVFNGEIYNFRALRVDLEKRGHRFRSASDTEAILHLYEEKGVDCLLGLRGMFAFALWDARQRTLFLARDRLGKKPLFYCHNQRSFLFASEPKAILQDRRVCAEADPEAIHHFLTYGYVPSPWSAFRGIRKLPPAHYLLVRDGKISVQRYWSLHYTPKRCGREDGLGEELISLLEEAVRLRMISDVPLGGLLSGGIDSSTVVALMRRFTSAPVRTFAIGFDDPEYNELSYARQVARRFETDHHELVVKPDAVALLPKMVWHFNEPFADSSALPSFYLCDMARGQVTVALNGDGGDEAFLGYDRYLGTKLAGWLDCLPASVRRLLLRGVKVFPSDRPKSTPFRLRRFSEALAMEPRQRYGRWVCCFENGLKNSLYTPEWSAEMRGRDSMALLEAAYERSDATSFPEATAHTDLQMYLPDDLLVKMDIASMAHGLEVRSPFLDHHVIEFAASLPLSLKLRGLTEKFLLKKVMKNVLPESVLHRKKMGFGVPIDHWFRYELKELAYDVLLDARARQRGYFRPEVVRRFLVEHVEGRALHHFHLWTLLILELWYRTFIDQKCPLAPSLHI